MANIALATANTVHIVQSIQQLTAPAAEAITPGAPVRYDASAGTFTNGNGTSATEADVYGIATGDRAITAGMPLTAVKRGVLDGFTFTTNFGTGVFVSDTDGRLADAAGMTTKRVGTIVAGTATTLGTAYDKLLSVEL